MRAGAARGLTGHFHEAGFYASDAEFRALVVPFIDEGVAAGEPVIIGYDDRKTALLRSWVRHPSAVTFIEDATLYATPARAIETYRRLFEHYVAAGVQQIRIAGDVPHPGNGGRFDGWDRYELAVNTVWDEFPVWGRCLYDARTVPAAVRGAVERTHPRIVTAAGERHASECYQEVSVFEPVRPLSDPLEDTTPIALLVDPSPARARQVLAHLGCGRVDSHTLDDLLIGVSETVTNARLHGRPPTTVRIWVAPERIVVHVRDSGPGPCDPLAGLVPTTTSRSGAGLGLWLIHQLDVDVALLAAPDGFTVRLRGGATPALTAG